MVWLAQLLIGFIFLIPPILGAVFFTLQVFGINGDVISLKHLSANWTNDKYSMSVAPIYLGLMAIAGSFISHSAIKNFLSFLRAEDGIDYIEITEE